MPKASRIYVCSSCGGEAPKWQGQCPHCGEWNSLSAFSRGGDLPGIGPTTTRAGAGTAVAARALELGEALSLAETAPRIPSGMVELDRVLGGGWVRGGVVLLGGDPGIGKSTLLLQVAADMSRRLPVLYASGEESASQIAMRARRLALDASRLALVEETELDAILQAAVERGAAFVVIDSIETVRLARVESAAGTPSQLRECAAELVHVAKRHGIAVAIVGHVTKEGAIAGPRLLEHLVDTVLYFESEAASRFRFVRATKNRFGAVNELAFFAMSESGLREVANPSAIFLARPTTAAPGSIVTVTRQGSRPLLVELQVLVDPLRFGNPRRVAQGLDAGRVAMLLAVLNRHAGLALQDHDVFANVVGGLDISETASDLPLVVALASSLRDRALAEDVFCFGEVGLTGEVRPVAYGEERLREAVKQGFRRAIVPRDNLPRRPIDGLAVAAVARVNEAIDAAFGLM